MAIVNTKFKSRYLALLETTDGLPNSAEFKATLSKGVEKMDHLNVILEGGPSVIMASPAETLGLVKL